MSIPQKEPGLAYQPCLEALSIAMPICKDQLDYEDVKALKLTCKGMKRIADGLITHLFVDGNNKDFEVLLRNPALLQNLRSLEILAQETFSITTYLSEIRRMLILAAQKLHQLTIARMPVQLSVLLKDISWPNLQFLCIAGDEVNLAGVKEEFLSMQKLRSLQFLDQPLSKEDSKVLASAPFLHQLTELILTMPSQGLTSKYMSSLLTSTVRLEKLWLIKCCNLDFLATTKLDHLKELELQYSRDADVEFGPILSQPRPSLEILIVNSGTLSTEELELLLSSAKTALPKLKCLKLSSTFPRHIAVGIDEEDDVNWTCLSEIDLPRLHDLELNCTFKDILGLTGSTANLPKLRSLKLEEFGRGHPQNYADYAEQMFSSTLFHQLVILDIHNNHFRIESLAILCKYASEMKKLKTLKVHSRDLEGVKMIADAGKAGGFPNLKTLHIANINRSFENNATFDRDLEDCLKKVWPEIEYKCHYDPFNNIERYGQEHEFLVLDEVWDSDDFDMSDESEGDYDDDDEESDENEEDLGNLE